MGMQAAVGGLFGGAQAVSGILGAGASNSAIRSGQDSVREAFRVRAAQINAQAAQQREEVIRRTKITEGAAAVSLARRGIAGTGTAASIFQQNAFDAARDIANIGTNRQNAIAAAASGANSDLAQLEGQITNPVLAAVTSSIQGIQTGVNFGTGLRDLMA